MNFKGNSDLNTIIEEQKKEIQYLKLQLESEKSESSKTAKELRDFYEEILTLMPGHIYWLDKNNVFLGCNDLQAKNAGLDSRKDIVGKTNFDMPWKDQAEELNKLNNIVMETGTPHVAEEYAVMADGTAVYLSNKTPLRDKDNNIIGVLGLSVDITERKKMEVALRRAKELAEVTNKAKNEFIANMSHDVRTPIQCIVDLSKQLKQETNSESAHGIYKCGIQILHILNSAFELINDNSLSDINTNMQPFHLAQRIQDIVDLVSPSIQLKNITLEVDIDSTIPDSLIADDTKMYRILLNLLTHAIAVSENGKVTLMAKLLSEDPAYAQLLFSIEDAGPTIPFDKHESYFNCVESQNQNLQIAQKYVGLLGGEIKLTSNPNQGSILSFTVSLKKELNN